MITRLVSWNVNGIRAVTGKEDWQKWNFGGDADVVGLQETKASVDQLKPGLVTPEGRFSQWCSSTVKKGYSGTAVFSKAKPLAVSCELPDPAYGGEGRIVHFEFEKFHFINGYFPNGGAEILAEGPKKHQGLFKRLDYKMGFFSCFAAWAAELRKKKPVVVCGDFNIAHREIDLAHPKQNELNTGFLKVERDFFSSLLEAGFIDSFRHVHGDVEKAYSWWSYKMRAREKNVGWRIDYFLVSEELRDSIADAWIESDQYGSDHCPVGLALEL